MAWKIFSAFNKKFLEIAFQKYSCFLKNKYPEISARIKEIKAIEEIKETKETDAIKEIKQRKIKS